MPTYLIKTKEGTKDPKTILERYQQLLQANIDLENQKLKNDKIVKGLGVYGRVSHSARFSWPYPDCLEVVYTMFFMMKPTDSQIDGVFREIVGGDCELYRKVS